MRKFKIAICLAVTATVFAIALSAHHAFAQGISGQEPDKQCSCCSSKLSDSRISLSGYNEIMEKLYVNRELPANELIAKAALLRLNTPYVANTLERGSKEELYVNLDETDCILFVESCLALVQTAKSSDTTYANFCRNIQNLRYRNGIVDGYPSRIHYTSEWLLQAEKNGFVKETSKEIAHTPLNQKFSFMTEKSDRYKHLKGNAANIAKIKQAEDYLNAHDYYYIPNDKIAEYASKIATGDIFGFCTSTKGLDLSHVGIAYWENGRLTFIHASMGAMKVIVEPSSIEKYAKSSKSTIGIRVAKPL